MSVNVKKEQLIIAIGIPVLIGSLSGFLVGDSANAYSQLIQPAIAPPGWLFPVVWTVLYILMGIASYLVATSGGESQKAQVVSALKLYAAQLIVNFLWPIIFFGKQWYGFAFLWIVLLWVLIILTIRAFNEVSKTAAILMIPYLLWVTFAGYLNLMIAILN